MTEPARAPEIRTTAGCVRGRMADGMAVFRGIPFAQPPVGPLHLAPPAPALPWEGVREAVSFGPTPPQSLGLGFGNGPEDADDSDEWLTVNVWSPDPAATARLPVMVWIYGGAYLVGSSEGPTYDGAALARRGAVVVTFNHRIGAEGYGHFEGAVPNRALLDQVAALEWVRDNIAGFGGDPHRVTVFGESAGAGAIAALLAMPRAAGLFCRAVAQSVPGSVFSPALAADVGASVAAELGLPATLDALAPVAPKALRDAADAVLGGINGRAARWGRIAHAHLPFSPVADGEVLPGSPWEVLRDGRSRDVELMVGHNRDEAQLFTVMSGRAGRITREEADTTLSRFAPGAGGAAAYRAAHPDADPTTLQTLVMSDWLFRMPSLHLAEAHAAGGGTAYLYELAWPAPAFGGALGACHGLDVPLVFGNLLGGIATLALGEEPPAEAWAVSDAMGRAWTAFAAHGDPGWAPLGTGERLTRVFAAEPNTVPYPEEPSRCIWAEHDFAALELSTETDSVAAS
ncbi:carboxylesterase/lipase family protein [Streptomyces xanthochromogenes]|uniref:carboxylesterase/lipase family protein n=1 Tax=Streptomyces xanthochromogenes TaxID=67384 RepID=UPI002F3EAE3B